ncbi:hypothetical protein EDB85DRAFT_1595877 [Lactarius pseudohatsudake]|nr:hypothetical protein EDB85DRAFT_1595877 [Lactarius pseudohatsudake]
MVDAFECDQGFDSEAVDEFFPANPRQGHGQCNPNRKIDQSHRRLCPVRRHTLPPPALHRALCICSHRRPFPARRCTLPPPALPRALRVCSRRRRCPARRLHPPTAGFAPRAAHLFPSLALPRASLYPPAPGLAPCAARLLPSLALPRASLYPHTAGFAPCAALLLLSPVLPCVSLACGMPYPPLLPAPATTPVPQTNRQSPHHGHIPASQPHRFLSRGCRVSLAASSIPYWLGVATSPRQQRPSFSIERRFALPPILYAVPPSFRLSPLTDFLSYHAPTPSRLASPTAPHKPRLVGAKQRLAKNNALTRIV